MERELLEFGKNIRVENGPARKVAVATEDLLDNRHTASHYYAGGRDAMGKKIVLGQEMTYLDYKGQWVWYLYEMDKTVGKFLPTAQFLEKDKAIKTARIRKRSKMLGGIFAHFLSSRG